MNITITGVFEAIDLVAKNPKVYRVLSIVSKKSLAKSMLSQLGHVKEKIVLEFDDATKEHNPLENSIASHEDCKKALRFIEKGGRCIVHCHAGVSRSTAVVLGYLLKINKNYKKAVDKLFQLRPSAEPNPHIVEIMCEILSKQEIFPDIMEYIRHKKNA